MRPTLVLFDVDGTLVDTAGAGRRGLERAFHDVFGIDDIREAAGRVRFEGKTDPTIIADIARQAGVPEPEIASRAVDLQSSYIAGLALEMDRHEPRRRIMPGVSALLDTLAARADVALGLLTGNIERGARIKLEPFGLNRYFADGGFASDHPDRVEIARIARERAQRRTGIVFEPERVTVVGDTDLDVLCARANNFRSVAVPSGWVSLERIEAAGPDVVLPSLEDLAVSLRALGLDGMPG